MNNRLDNDLEFRFDLDDSDTDDVKLHVELKPIITANTSLDEIRHHVKRAIRDYPTKDGQWYGPDKDEKETTIGAGPIGQQILIRRAHAEQVPEPIPMTNADDWFSPPPLSETAVEDIINAITTPLCLEDGIIRIQRNEANKDNDVKSNKIWIKQQQQDLKGKCEQFEIECKKGRKAASTQVKRQRNMKQKIQYQNEAKT